MSIYAKKKRWDKEKNRRESVWLTGIGIYAIMCVVVYGLTRIKPC